MPLHPHGPMQPAVLLPPHGPMQSAALLPPLEGQSCPHARDAPATPLPLTAAITPPAAQTVLPYGILDACPGWNGGEDLHFAPAASEMTATPKMWYTHGYEHHASFSYAAHQIDGLRALCRHAFASSWQGALHTLGHKHARFPRCELQNPSWGAVHSPRASKALWRCGST